LESDAEGAQPLCVSVCNLCRWDGVELCNVWFLKQWVVTLQEGHSVLQAGGRVLRNYLKDTHRFGMLVAAACETFHRFFTWL
jgi:hypothetical protein